MTPHNRTSEEYGERPHTYTHNKTPQHNNPAICVTYALRTGDWFEMGDAYSLHKDSAAANEYRTERWWYETSKSKVYISKETLEEIVKNGAVFRSSER